MTPAEVNARPNKYVKKKNENHKATRGFSGKITLTNPSFFRFQLNKTWRLEGNNLFPILAIKHRDVLRNSAEKLC